MKKTKTRLAVCVTLLVLILGFIWGNSLLPGEVSGAFSAKVKDFLASLFGWENAESDPSGHGLLRKLAHATEFCVLGMCLNWLMHMLRSKKLQAVLLSIGGGLLVASIDETIQCFIPGRGPGIKDVGVDMLGFVLGTLILLGVACRKHGKGKILEEIKQ
jgi:VanZ family protein